MTRFGAHWVLYNLKRRGLLLVTVNRESSLIDLDAEMQTGRKQIDIVQRERLSGKTSLWDDATGCSCENRNRKRWTEQKRSILPILSDVTTGDITNLPGPGIAFA